MRQFELLRVKFPEEFFREFFEFVWNDVELIRLLLICFVPVNWHLNRLRLSTTHKTEKTLKEAETDRIIGFGNYVAPGSLCDRPIPTHTGRFALHISHHRRTHVQPNELHQLNGSTRRWPFASDPLTHRPSVRPPVVVSCRPPPE